MASVFLNLLEDKVQYQLRQEIQPPPSCVKDILSKEVLKLFCPKYLPENFLTEDYDNLDEAFLLLRNMN